MKTINLEWTTIKEYGQPTMCGLWNILYEGYANESGIIKLGLRTTYAS